MEICETFRLQRETFYLSVDYMDRYLGVALAVPKSKLKLIGITCLYIGAKIDMNAPKLKDVAYVAGKPDFALQTYIIFIFRRFLH